MARIAIILGRLVIGGTTMDTLQVAQQLQHHHQVLLITGGGDKDEFEAAYLTEHLPGIRQERIDGFSRSLHPLRDMAAYWAIRRVLRKFQPQIVHTHTAKAGLLGRLAAAAEHVPMIVHTYHGLLFSGYYGPLLSSLVIKLERWLAAKTHRIIALSATQKQQLVSDYQICPAEKISIIPLGIDLALFAKDQINKRKSFRDKYAIAEAEMAVGIIGRVVPIKHHAFFLEAIARLQQQGISARYFIIGDGPLRKKLFAQADALGIDATYFPEDPRPATLTFTSWMTEVDKAMSGLDLVVLTSLSEGTPISLMEAQACGVPVVATLAGGISDILPDGLSGFITPQGNLGVFTEKLALLLKDRDLRGRMGQNGRNYAQLHFVKERQLGQINALYASSSPGPHSPKIV